MKGYVWCITAENLEMIATAVETDLLLSLLALNQIEFGDTGKVGMCDLIEQGVDHYLWGDWPVSYNNVIHKVETYDGFGIYIDPIHPLVS